MKISYKFMNKIGRNGVSDLSLLKRKWYKVSKVNSFYCTIYIGNGLTPKLILLLNQLLQSDSHYISYSPTTN